MDRIRPKNHDQCGYLTEMNSSYIFHFKKLDSQDNVVMMESIRELGTRMRYSLRSNHSNDTQTDLNNGNLHKVISIYKNRLTRFDIKCMNENLIYLLDCVEVLVCEFDDYKSFFTTIININLMFGIVLLSILVSMIFQSTEIQSTLIAIGAGSASTFPLLWSLFIGAASELAVSNKFRELLLLQLITKCSIF